MAFETKNFFNSTIKQVYQQTGAVLSLESRSDRQVLINSLKLFESTFVYNWQKILYPLLKGPEGSPYQTYSGMRSKPWAEYDSLDSVFGGIHGWTLTAEPWATEDSIPALWDSVNKQPHSITGALYYLSEKIESLAFDESMFTIPEFDDSELQASIDCLDKNLTTIFKDVYGCGYKMDCDGNRDQEYSLYTHIYQIFDQLIDGGPSISVDDTCENNYPAMSIYMPTSALTYDVKIPSTEVSGYCSSNVYLELRTISTYTGMNCDTNPLYSQFGSLTYISDGSTFLKSIYDLDNALSNFSSTKTLQEAYIDGWDDSLNYRPGRITVINNNNKTLGKEGFGILHPYTRPYWSTNGGLSQFGGNAGAVIDSPLLSVEDEALSGSDYTINAFTQRWSSPDADRWFSHLEVGEHEVGRNAQINLPNPLKYGDFIYPNVHIFRSILNQMPTSGIPRTRSSATDYSGFSQHLMNETAIWVADGYSRNGTVLWSDLPTTAQPFDCDGNVVSANNLYFRQPSDGDIFKLNKCGLTIQLNSGGSSFQWGTDVPLGAAAFHSLDSQGSHAYFASDIFFVNPDENGVTVGWGGSSDLSSQAGAITTDTFTIQEHYQGDLAKASLNLRSVNTGSKEEIVFSHGAYGSNTELASIATSMSDDFTFSTNDDNKDIVFKPYNTENLRLYTSGLAKFSGNLWVAGSLLVDGETTYINSSTLQVDDKNIELGTVDTPTDITADGGGITLKAASDKTITWSSSDNTWNSNVGFRSEGGFYLAADTSILLDSAEGYNGLASASKPFDESFVIDSYVESLKFGNAAGDQGKIRYQSNDFEGHNGTSWVSLTASGGIDLTDLSVSTAAASGSGSLSYNNTNGTFTFTPPDLSGLGGSDNLGNHTATQNLNMSNYQINNTYKLNMVSVSNQHPEINSPTALDFNSQTASSTTVCDYNFGARSGAPASLNLATGSAGASFHIQARSGSTSTTVMHLPGQSPSVNQILKVTSVNGNQAYMDWSDECCDVVAPSIETINTSTGDPSGNGSVTWDGASDTLTYNPPDLSGLVSFGDLSVTTGDPTPGSAGSLSYSEGVFTFTPPDITAANSFSGNYADLTGAPTIPTSTSELTNDSGFINQETTITGSGATTVTGSYPSFTISSTDTNTWRPVQVNGAAIGTSDTLNLIAGTNVSIVKSGGNVTISSTASGGTGDITGVTFTTGSGTTSDLTGSADFTITGNNGISTSASGSTITISSNGNSHVEVVDLSTASFLTSTSNFYFKSEYFVHDNGSDGTFNNEFRISAAGFSAGSTITVHNLKTNLANNLTIVSYDDRGAVANFLLPVTNAGPGNTVNSFSLAGTKSITFVVDSVGRLIYRG